MASTTAKWHISQPGSSVFLCLTSGCKSVRVEFIRMLPILGVSVDTNSINDNRRAFWDQSASQHAILHGETRAAHSNRRVQAKCLPSIQSSIPIKQASSSNIYLFYNHIQIFHLYKLLCSGNYI